MAARSVQWPVESAQTLSDVFASGLSAVDTTAYGSARAAGTRTAITISAQIPARNARITMWDPPIEPTLSGLRGPVDDQPPGHVRITTHGAASQQADGLGQQPVLQRAQEVVQSLAVDAVRDVDRRLEQYRPAVDALVDEVDGDPRDLDAVGERVGDSIESGERREERRVDVHDAIRESGEERGGQQLHVPG